MTPADLEDRRAFVGSWLLYGSVPVQSVGALSGYRFRDGRFAPVDLRMGVARLELSQFGRLPDEHAGKDRLDDSSDARVLGDIDVDRDANAPGRILDDVDRAAPEERCEYRRVLLDPRDVPAEHDDREDERRRDREGARDAEHVAIRWTAERGHDDDCTVEQDAEREATSTGGAGSRAGWLATGS